MKPKKILLRRIKDFSPSLWNKTKKTFWTQTQQLQTTHHKVRSHSSDYHCTDPTTAHSDISKTRSSWILDFIRVLPDTESTVKRHIQQNGWEYLSWLFSYICRFSNSPSLLTKNSRKEDTNVPLMMSSCSGILKVLYIRHHNPSSDCPPVHGHWFAEGYETTRASLVA